MAAYVIAMMKVTDPEGYEVYKEVAPPTIAGYEGRYLARGGRTDVLEGNPDADRFVVLEFESYEQAREWWNSPEYELAKPHRGKSAASTLVLVDGV
jgi:uncharacterized protein (DUF1330 family)